MSYCRFSGDSDVYVIGTLLDGKEVFECVACSFRKLEWKDADDHFLGGYLAPVEGDPGPFYNASRVETIVHLLEHRVQGELVPKYAIDALLAEREWGEP